jgi:hypothetical protein
VRGRAPNAWVSVVLQMLRGLGCTEAKPAVTSPQLAQPDLPSFSRGGTNYGLMGTAYGRVLGRGPGLNLDMPPWLEMWCVGAPLVLTNYTC